MATNRRRSLVRIVALALAISSVYVAYSMSPYSRIWRRQCVRQADGHLRCLGVRARDWPFLPLALPHGLTVEALYGRDHPGIWHFTLVGWLASLPVSALYGWAVVALLRSSSRPRRDPVATQPD